MQLRRRQAAALGPTEFDTQPRRDYEKSHRLTRARCTCSERHISQERYGRIQGATGTPRRGSPACHGYLLAPLTCAGQLLHSLPGCFLTCLFKMSARFHLAACGQLGYMPANRLGCPGSN